MDSEDKSLEDGDGLDGPIAFKGATLRIQQDNLTEDAATLHMCQSSKELRLSTEAAAIEDKTTSDSPSQSKPGGSGSDIASVSWPEDHIKNLFVARDGLVDQAILDCTKAFVNPDIDGDILGFWILTEINIWDAEKERLVFLTTNSLLVIKFDFIALKPLDFRRTLLRQIDTIVEGDLVYPPASLVPRMNGLASGVSSIVKGCLLHWARPSELCQTALDVSQFEPRARNVRGLRIMWNNGEPIAFSKKWNPFNNDIPFLTFVSHPLLWHKEATTQEDQQIKKPTVSYSVETLSQQLLEPLEKLGKSFKSLVQYKPILLHNYLSLGSLIHNRNSLGFFKVRGRFSF